MTKDEFKAIVKRIRGYYPDKAFLENKESLSLWYERLEKCPYEIARRAADRYADTNPFPPHFSDLKQSIEAVFECDIKAAEKAYYDDAVRRFADD